MKTLLALVLCALLTVPLVTRAQDATATPTTDTATANQPKLAMFIGDDHFSAGLAAMQDNDYEAATQHFSLFLLLNPTIADGYLLRGEALYALKQNDAALADFDHALTLPDLPADISAQAHLDRALILFDSNQDDAALEALNASLKAQSNASALYNRALVYMAQGDFNAALTDIDAVIAERPDLEPAYLARGDAHRELQQFDAALADYDHAIQLQPDDLIGYVRRANIFMGQTQPDLALIEYNRALDINSNAAIIYLMRSEAYKQTAQEAEAAADYLSWIRLIGTNNAVQDALQAGESRVLQMKEGQVFTLPFEGTAGQTITVTAQAQPDVQLDPLFLIMDADGNPLVGDDDSGANLDAQVTVTLPADGVYAVVLSHGGGGSDGPVSVKLTVG